MSELALFGSLELPNGAKIKNRICKAAMEENMAEYGQVPGWQLHTLYSQWSSGGVGLILTGNVMVAPNAMTGAGGIVLQQESALEPFKQWAKCATQNGAHCWVQLSHPGRQIYANLGEQALSPSNVLMDMGGFSKMFAQPRALTEEEIEGIIERFGQSAGLSENVGFTGVQIHAAHGYLISQFLSPLVNQRDDQWGGELSNRARFLFEVVKRVRKEVSSEFCVSVKLNSADFQKGGFTNQEAQWVVEQLNGMDVDLVELSGGSYESPAMQGNPVDNSTGRREAYFIDFAREVASVAAMPIMVTGGIMRKSVAEGALTPERNLPAVNMVGIATALAYYPNLPNLWHNDVHSDVRIPKVNWKNKTMAALGTMALTKYQLDLASKGKACKPGASPIVAILKDRLKVNKQTKRYKKWRLKTT